MHSMPFMYLPIDLPEPTAPPTSISTGDENSESYKPAFVESSGMNQKQDNPNSNNYSSYQQYPNSSYYPQRQTNYYPSNSYTWGATYAPDYPNQPNTGYDGSQNYNPSYYPYQSTPGYPSSKKSEGLSYDEIRFLNAPQYFVSPTVSVGPASFGVQTKTGLPLGFVFQPLAPVPEGYPEVPNVDFKEAPLRCKFCSAYINPFVKWESNGDRWFCNMCGKLNNTPASYLNMKPADANGKRISRMDRPELSNGSYETSVTSSYIARPPQPPIFMFIIEVSANAVQTGLINAACTAIKNIVENEIGKNWSRAKIGIITFDSSVHFYDISSQLSPPKMLVVPISDLFLPLSKDILVNVKECSRAILNLLNRLPDMFTNNTISETCLGSAIEAAHMAMNHIGGKMSVFFSTLPKIGKYALAGKSRSSVNQNGRRMQNDMHFLKPLDDSFKDKAEELCEKQISVDLYACPTQSVDLASLSIFCKITSGNLFYYPQFGSFLHQDKIVRELTHNLFNNIGWESILKFRVSKGLKLTNWMGHFHLNPTKLIVPPNLKTSQSITVTLELEEVLPQDAVLYIQCGLLYTNPNGVRLLRVHTYALPTSSDPMTVINSMNAGTVASILCQNSIETALSTSLADARNFLNTQCKQIVSAQSESVSYGTRLLLMYILGILKSIAFRESQEVTADMRIYHLRRLENLPLDLQIPYFYPTLLPLHNLTERQGYSDDNLSVILPDPLNLTQQVLSEDGAYILDDGETMLLWIGRAVPTTWLQQVFGVYSSDEINSEYAEARIASTQTILSRRIYAIINELRRLHNLPYLKLYLVKPKEPSEQKFYMSLIEDSTTSLRISLMDFMTQTGCWKR